MSNNCCSLTGPIPMLECTPDTGYTIKEIKIHPNGKCYEDGIYIGKLVETHGGWIIKKKGKEVSREFLLPSFQLGSNKYYHR